MRSARAWSVLLFIGSLLLLVLLLAVLILPFLTITTHGLSG